MTTGISRLRWGHSMTTIAQTQGQVGGWRHPPLVPSSLWWSGGHCRVTTPLPLCSPPGHSSQRAGPLETLAVSRCGFCVCGPLTFGQSLLLSIHFCRCVHLAPVRVPSSQARRGGGVYTEAPPPACTAPWGGDNFHGGAPGPWGGGCVPHAVEGSHYGRGILWR